MDVQGVWGPPRSVGCLRLDVGSVWGPTVDVRGYLGIYGYLGYMEIICGCWEYVGTVYRHPGCMGTSCEVWETWGPSVSIWGV